MKWDRDQDKRAKLAAAIEKEHQAAIGEQDTAFAFRAAQAVEEARTTGRIATRREKYETDGCVFPMKVPRKESTSTPHFAYYLENQEAMRELIGHTVTDEDGKERVEPAKLLRSDRELAKP